jgi:hypothetical protein
VKFSCRKAQCRSEIHRSVDKCEITESVINNMKSVRTPENIHYVEQSPRKSVKHLTQQLNLEASLKYRIIPGDFW